MLVRSLRAHATLDSPCVALLSCNNTNSWWRVWRNDPWCQLDEHFRPYREMSDAARMCGYIQCTLRFTVKILKKKKNYNKNKKYSDGATGLCQANEPNAHYPSRIFTATSQSKYPRSSSIKLFLPWVTESWKAYVVQRRLHNQTFTRKETVESRAE